MVVKGDAMFQQHETAALESVTKQNDRPNVQGFRGGRGPPSPPATPAPPPGSLSTLITTYFLATAMGC